MVQRIGTGRRKTRHKFMKPSRQKSKISLTNYFQKLEIGNKVALSADSSVHKGMYHPNYHGLIGEVRGKIGECYEVSITDGSKQKLLIVHPVHLKKR